MQAHDHFFRYIATYHNRQGCYTSGTNVGFSSPRFAYIKSGSCRVEYGDGVLYLKPGYVWYIPKGAPYTSYWDTKDDVIFNKLEFELDDFSLTYKTMQAFSMPESKDDFTYLCEKHDQSSAFGNMSAFFSILNELTPLLKKEDSTSLHRILPALKYLQQQDCTNVQVKQLAKMCYMSASRFYEVFREAVGDSPVNYKNKIKVSRAKMLIQDGKTLDEVCELLHFSSASFLRRMMKKHLGITPKEAKQNESI